MYLGRSAFVISPHKFVGQTRYVQRIVDKILLVTTTAVYVTKRENAIVNRLNKTKDERVVDHEQERIDRIKKENTIKRAAAAEKVIKHFCKDDPNLNSDIRIHFRKSKTLN